jgi:hypothetical protein
LIEDALRVCDEVGGKAAGEEANHANGREREITHIDEIAKMPYDGHADQPSRNPAIEVRLERIGVNDLHAFSPREARNAQRVGKKGE